MRIFIIGIMILFAEGCSNVFYQPSPKHFVDPQQFKLTYENHYFKSRDGTLLHGWLFPTKSKKPKGTIVQFHGNAQNISTHFFSLIWLVEAGYNLFTFDYRGYAKSKGEPSQGGIYQDALSALDISYLLHQKNGGGKFIIYGQSTGGAISLRAIPDWAHEQNIDLIVMDSAFGSYKDIAFDKLRSKWFLFPFSPLAFLLISDEYAADEVFHRISSPVLTIVGVNDEIVPSKFGKLIHEGVASKQKWIWTLPEGNHIDVFHHKEGIYRKQFLDLVDQISPR
jgi:fermentation-respiration switch protein FrsA (DUF1100 family)